MLANTIWFVAGLALLIVGAEVMVRGGAGVAVRLGISPIVIGLTVVSIGTSMPELAVGVVAAGEGSGALAVGNIAGTNVVNVLLILGLSAALLPLALQTRTIRFELPMMAAAALLLLVLAADGVLTRIDGAILVSLAVVYTVAVIWSARRESRAVAQEFAAELASEFTTEEPGSVKTRTTVNVAMTIGGIAVVVVGADWLVDGAVGMARQFGVSDALIGLTVVAIGTSAPELVTTLISTVRGDRDIAIGNLIGSSIYNILLILGITCLVPAQGLVLPSSLVTIDLPIMVAVALLCIPIFISGRRVSRIEGGLMVSAYVAYLTYLLIAQT
ncbi:calcium/sodium antiporter [Mycolicibacterium flavescens]|uniref:Sodium:calcium antiporter n=1 Tax=Mycolicibacterium flavescens TaxID=1776 RepID=A0A1E3RLL1_MYCFV|nr:calcium/sodium antiporter [Mycolicibacterium flavescens]MCV7281849.1 calcium/sodium antiporter [Mycolicibacterium flavescens]ODQ90773.1 sodium:calcium antiporter [Mycolicibacterium flavescens]